MGKIQIEKNKCIISLNKEFYPEDIIKKGINSFENNKNISFSQGKIEIKKDKNLNLENTAYELCDHFLSLIQGGSQWH